jgi:peptidoglycan/LPS O-acetylase OafA/YrhL
MPPWQGPDISLASDPDLRQLQLRWLRDELWMRRIMFAILLVSTVAMIVAVVLWPGAALRALGGVALSSCGAAAYASRRGRSPTTGS